MPTAPDDYSREVPTGELPAITEIVSPATVLDFPAFTVTDPASITPGVLADSARLALAAKAAVDQRYIEWRVLKEQAKTWALYVATILMVAAALTIGAIGVKILVSWH